MFTQRRSKTLRYRMAEPDSAWTPDRLELHAHHLRLLSRAGGA
jgi:hypothetical protein